MALVICSLGAGAQTTRIITGAVIDKNGNPIPNALVEATGGAESVTTDADGSFRIEVPFWLKSLTASYAGLEEKKIKLKKKEQIVFELKPNKRESWFIDGAVSTNLNGYGYGRLGLMAGYLGKWGGYAKAMIGDYSAVTVGGIKSISKRVYLYLGVGCATIDKSDEPTGAMFEIGTILKFNKINLGIGYGLNTHERTRDSEAQLTVGYCF